MGIGKSPRAFQNIRPGLLRAQSCARAYGLGPGPIPALIITMIVTITIQHNVMMTTIMMTTMITNKMRTETVKVETT